MKFILDRSGRWHDARGHFALADDVQAWALDDGQVYASTFSQDAAGRFRQAGRFISNAMASVLEDLFDYEPGESYDYEPPSRAVPQSAGFDLPNTTSWDMRAHASEMVRGNLSSGLGALAELGPSSAGWYVEFFGHIEVQHRRRGEGGLSTDHYDISKGPAMVGYSDPREALGRFLETIFEGTGWEGYTESIESCMSGLHVEMWST